jgi:hypothetical protein
LNHHAIGHKQGLKRDGNGSSLAEKLFNKRVFSGACKKMRKNRITNQRLGKTERDSLSKENNMKHQVMYLVLE